MRRSAAALATVALALAGCGEEPPPPPEPAPSTPAPQASAGGCRTVPTPPPGREGDREAPRQSLDEDATYEATVTTNCGAFAFELDTDAAPRASASFVALARDGYFEDTIFHRIVPGFVIQGGDPTATGSGGPGYDTRDRPPSDASYGRGVVAMAKAGDEPAGTAGSQFFVVTAPDAGLPPDYAVLGQVTSGQDVVDRIGRLGNESEQPTQAVVIERVEIAERPG